MKGRPPPTLLLLALSLVPIGCSKSKASSTSDGPSASSSAPRQLQSVSTNQQFWALASVRVPALTRASSANDATYDELYAALQKVAPGLSLQFKAGGGELIITADGDRKLFAHAREVVAAAPHIPGWKIIALKPKLGFPVSTEWEGTTIRADDMFFLPLSRKNSDELGLRIYVKGLPAGDAEPATEAAHRMLDNGLGEERFALAVRHLEVLPWPDRMTETVYPIRELDSFIAQREKKQVAK